MIEVDAFLAQKENYGPQHHALVQLLGSNHQKTSPAVTTGTPGLETLKKPTVIAELQDELPMETELRRRERESLVAECNSEPRERPSS